VDSRKKHLSSPPAKNPCYPNHAEGPAPEKKNSTVSKTSILESIPFSRQGSLCKESFLEPRERTSILAENAEGGCDPKRRGGRKGRLNTMFVSMRKDPRPTQDYENANWGRLHSLGQAQKVEPDRN